MGIKSNASTGEKGSPYYRENESICKSWEDWTLRENGKIQGNYNAWSYSLVILINEKLKIQVKKATYSNGNLLLSSKYQNLQEDVIFEALINKNIPKFQLRKNNWFMRILGRRTRQSKFYFLSKQYKNNPAINDILSLFEMPIKQKKVQTIEFDPSVSILSIRISHFNKCEDLATSFLNYCFK